MNRFLAPLAAAALSAAEPALAQEPIQPNAQPTQATNETRAELPTWTTTRVPVSDLTGGETGVIIDITPPSYPARPQHPPFEDLTQ